MRRAILILAVAASAHGQSFTVNGFLTGREAYVTGQPSWITGGFGRLGAGARGVGEHAYRGTAVAQLGADWRPTGWLTAHAQLLGRAEPSGSRGKRAGVVEAFVDLHNEHWRVRGGQFFLGTSRENTDPLWTSRYAQTFSALNTWIGEEFRPVGVDLQWSPNFYGSLGATAFRNNDTSGALLAWRGWSVGNRLSVYDEVLPLPPLRSLQTTFTKQRRDGTVPFETDLDGRTGYSARVRYSVPQRANVIYTYLDNRGDRELHRGEYAWATKFHLLGLEVGDPDQLVLAGEYMRGSTTMGRGVMFVDADFFAAYLLVSGKSGRNRLTARYELFNTEEQDFSPAETNEENGRSWTLTWMFDVSTPLRVAAELTQVVGDRADTPDPDGRSVTVEARWKF